MGTTKEPKEVKVFAAALYSEGYVIEKAVSELEKRFGKTAIKSPVFDFTFTDYYEAEMGAGLKKTFIGFKRPIDPGKLAEIKVFTNQIEQRLAVERNGALRRRANIDPGYVGKASVVLASTKNRSQRIYLGDGIYGEVTLLYHDGDWQPLPWTYPDYQTTLAKNFFTGLRNL